MKKIQIKNPEKLVEESIKFKNIIFDMLGKMKDTAETRALKEKLQKCDDLAELLQIATEITLKANQEAEKIKMGKQKGS